MGCGSKVVLSVFFDTASGKDCGKDCGKACRLALIAKSGE
jgi:hypothetical protein